MSELASFTHTTVPVVGKVVHRLGVAGNYGLSADDARWAAEQGASYWAWSARMPITPALKELLRGERERHVIAAYGLGGWGGQVARAVDRARRALATDYLDVFVLGWLGRTSRYSPGIVDTLLELKEAGTIRAIGTSIHDRQRAGRLVADSAVDLFMLRYNAKHPGAEVDVFPHLAARQPAVVAYTATSWRQLLRPLAGFGMPPWPGGGEPPPPPLTAGLCYRFCLSSPHVHVVLTGPRTRAELAENLEAVEAGPLTAEELAWVRAYGRAVKARKRFDYLP